MYHLYLWRPNGTSQWALSGPPTVPNEKTITFSVYIGFEKWYASRMKCSRLQHWRVVWYGGVPAYGMPLLCWAVRHIFRRAQQPVDIAFDDDEGCVCVFGQGRRQTSMHRSSIESVSPSPLVVVECRWHRAHSYSFWFCVPLLSTLIYIWLAFKWDWHSMTRVKSDYIQIKTYNSPFFSLAQNAEPNWCLFILLALKCMQSNMMENTIISRHCWLVEFWLCAPLRLHCVACSRHVDAIRRFDAGDCRATSAGSSDISDIYIYIVVILIGCWQLLTIAVCKWHRRHQCVAMQTTEIAGDTLQSMPNLLVNGKWGLG